jgi:hypothetical protein
MGRREIADCRHADPHHEPCRQSQDCGSAAGSMGKGEGGEEGRTGSEVGLSAWRVFLALSCSDRLVFLIAAAVHRRMCGVDPGAGAGPRAESSWRKHVMSELRDILDMADPYDAHAYFMCGFSCDDCQAELGPTKVSRVSTTGAADTSPIRRKPQAGTCRLLTVLKGAATSRHVTVLSVRRSEKFDEHITEQTGSRQ